MRARLMHWIQHVLWPLTACEHEWEYVGTGDFTGYIERCRRCGEIVQVPQ